MEPADAEDKPVFVGRFNIGAVSLHLPMIYAKAKQESRPFFEVLDYYLELFVSCISVPMPTSAKCVPLQILWRIVRAVFTAVT